jgi:hypothetical protein
VSDEQARKIGSNGRDRRRLRGGRLPGLCGCFASVYIEGNADYSALSAAQQLQLEKYIGEGLNIWEFAFASHRSGLINDETWEAWDRHFQGELQAAEVWRLGWAFKRDSYAASFQAHLDAVLADN